jgi:hypothetical protein
MAMNFKFHFYRALDQMIFDFYLIYLHSLRKLRQGPHQTNRQPNFFEDNLTDRFAELHFKNVSNVIFSFSFPISFSKFQAANICMLNPQKQILTNTV